MEAEKLHCIITGANSGLGRATALELAKKGAHVILEASAQEVIKEIHENTSGTAEFIKLDLESLDSVKNFVSEFSARKLPLNLLVNNAARLGSWPIKSQDGIDVCFQVNYLGHWVLTMLLLPKLKESTSRIVLVTSESYRLNYYSSRIEIEDLVNGDSLKNSQIGLGLYGRSKACVLLFMKKLIDILEGTNISVHAVDPGALKSKLGTEVAPWYLAWIKNLLNWFFPTPERACKPLVQIATSPEFGESTGRYIVYGKEATHTIRPVAKDDSACEALWKLSFELTGLEEHKILKAVK